MSSRTDDRRLPPVHERLVMPETRHEVIDGQVVYVSPADPPHATQHSKLQALLEASAAEGFTVACDMLTRTSALGDMAPDASVFRGGVDPDTGERELEALAFEIASTERMPDCGKKAARLVERGVRRVFAIEVNRRRACEWRAELEGWEILADDHAISDEALAVPLPISALVSAARVDDAVARALILRRNPVIEAALLARLAQGTKEGIEQGIEQGRRAGKLSALLAILKARGVQVSAADVARFESGSEEELDRWLVAASVDRSVP